MELHNMKPTPGSRHTKKRIGRGDKTAGRGENGQKSRSGYSQKIGFEGGQNPLYRRLPKRGFTNAPFKTVYTIVNLDSLEALGVAEITPETLIEAKIIRKHYGVLKVLGNGEIKSPLKVSAHKFSKTAQDAIEKAGGSITVLIKQEPIIKEDRAFRRAAAAEAAKGNGSTTPVVEEAPKVATEATPTAE